MDRKTPEYRKLVETARNRYTRALAIGKLIKQPCQVCGNTKSEGHHDDYLFPLQVTWLCRSHHKAKHQQLGWGLASKRYSGTGDMTNLQATINQNADG